MFVKKPAPALKRASRPAIFWLIVLIGAAVMFCPWEIKAEEAPVRPSILAGTWYPGDAKSLGLQISDFLTRARPPKVSGRLVALVAPHAGYVYSGQVAAHAFALLKGRSFETVVMVGPSHRLRFSGVSVNTQDYKTPLGRVRVDRDLAAKIIKSGGGAVFSRPDVHAQEHCLEIELPFLQVVLDKAKIVPIIMGSHDLATCRTLAQTLAQVLRGKNALLLVSTDLSHYHPGDEARTMDEALIKRVQAFDPLPLHQDLISGRIEACGGGPLIAVMMAAKALGANQAVILKYAHSGDVTGDNSKVVGYLSAAFTQKEHGRNPSPGVSLGLDLEDQRLLLTIARQSITAALEGKKFNLPADLPPRLTEKRGAFVTLKRLGRLRGCIGRLQAEKPLAKVIAAMARQAAFHDPRFPRLTKAELEGLSVEISVLTPFRLVKDVEEIQVGVHGLLIAKGSYQGLLLPQVPVEWGWDREEFLRQTCRKAGLPPQAWKEGAKIFRFSAQVFGEEDVKARPESRSR